MSLRKRPLQIKPFLPRGLLAHPDLQSVLATKGPRRMLCQWRLPEMDRAARLHILDCGEGVRLAGYHSRHPRSRGIAILIHGWEGSHDSAYLYAMACALYTAHYSVFRLNLRDHGDTHDLNELPFHSARITEVLGAVRRIRDLEPAGPLYCIGFSLGGNFALRVGLRGPAAGITPDLSIGISPVINPESTLLAIDNGGAMYRRYFLERWHRTLRKKAAAWPGRFDFSSLLRLQHLVDVTRQFAVYFTEYGSYEAYLNAYTLLPQALMEAPAPLAIITAQDDPIIPYHDFRGLDESASLQAYLTPRYGGHCGFIEDWTMHAWAEHCVIKLLDANTATASLAHAGSRDGDH